MAVSQREKEEQLNSMSAAVKIVIDNYPDGHKFYGNELKDDVVRIYPQAVNCYPDTILRMARRHRRYAFCVVDQNKSLYKKVAVKSIVEQIKELAPKVEVKKEHPAAPAAQGFLFPNQGFFAGVFLFLALGAFFSLEAAFGRPLIPPSLMASKSASLYIPTGPMYLNGRLPFLCSLLFTPSEETPKIRDISNAVSSFINLSIYGINTQDQEGKCQNVPNMGDLLYVRKVKSQKICKFMKIFYLTLDNPLGQGVYFRYVLVFR